MQKTMFHDKSHANLSLKQWGVAGPPASFGANSCLPYALGKVAEVDTTRLSSEHLTQIPIMESEQVMSSKLKLLSLSPCSSRHMASV